MGAPLFPYPAPLRSVVHFLLYVLLLQTTSIRRSKSSCTRVARFVEFVPNSESPHLVAILSEGHLARPCCFHYQLSHDVQILLFPDLVLGA